MRHFNIAILITSLALNFSLVSCNQTSKSDEKEKALIEKENDLLKKENELLKKEQKLNQKTIDVTTDNSIEKQSENSILDNLDFLKRLNGKYPYHVKLLDNSALAKRLIKLLGNSRYNFLKENWDVETPMEFKNNIFVASACQAHACGYTEFIIVFDFSKNVMYASIREEGNVRTYSEDGSYSQEINERGYGN